MVVNGVEVKVNGLNDVSEREILNYINYTPVVDFNLQTLSVPQQGYHLTPR